MKQININDIPVNRYEESYITPSGKPLYRSHLIAQQFESSNLLTHDLFDTNKKNINEHIIHDFKHMTRSELQELITCTYSKQELCKHTGPKHDTYCHMIKLSLSSMVT